MRANSLLSAATVVSCAIASASCSQCKCFPGDDCWPSVEEWTSLNSSVNGNLIKTVPLGSPCHDPYYDEEECNLLKSEWQYAPVHMNSSSSVMAPWFANQSCDPWQPQDRPCELGNYVRYAVDVQDSSDVVNAISFANEHNIRFVVRNTGHDYNGRSTGAGSLSVWTHHLKDIEFIDWSSRSYKGKAVKVGAGVQGFDILEAGLDAGYVTVGGECPTVGVAGGYTQGGGHSALSTSFGLSADNTLEWEVVTAKGAVVKASRTENSDLFWALSGGGGGNWGVVMSVTIKAFPSKQVGGATMTFLNDGDDEKFYNGIKAFHEELPSMVDAGSMVVHYFTNTFFSIAPLTAFGQSKSDVKKIMKRFVKKLDKLDQNYTVAYGSSKNYYKHYDTYFGPLPEGNIQVGIAQYGGRLIPRSVVENNLDGFMKVARSLAENGVTYIGVGTNVSAFGDDESNSVLPAWRKTLTHATLTLPWNFTAPWSEMKALQDKMTDEIMPEIEEVTPGSGAYQNEADFRQPNFQEVFYGSKYDDLVDIKNKWDPHGFFYATNAVGSEGWTVADDGRLCRASS